jgi:apolipoprotein N-acyltransferase
VKPLPAPAPKFSGANPSRLFLLIVLFILIPVSLISTVVFLFSARAPVGLTMAETTAGSLLVIVSLHLGRSLLQKNRADGGGVEIFFWFVMGAALAASLLAFFVLRLEIRDRLSFGVINAVLFLFVACLYVVWARWARLAAIEGTGLRAPRLSAIAERVLLIIAGAFFFAMSFPGFVFPEGFGPMAFISLVPVFLVLGRSGWIESACYGAAYGFLAHALFNYWLATFNPVALTVVLSIRVVYYILLFLVLKLAVKFFPRWGFVLQTVIWVGYEFLSAQGFIAYSYGIFGYSQYQCIPLLQSAALAGVWGLSLLVIFPGAYLGHLLRNGRRNVIPAFRSTWLAPAGYAVLFIAALVYGFASRTDTARLPRLRVASIQPNIDPWVGGELAYESSVRIHIRLSAEAERSRPDLVVWPETALVPSLRYHSTVRDDQERYNNVIRPFLEFMDTQKAPYLIGNNDREIAGREPDGSVLMKSYNAALLMSGREIKGLYRKTHLVPFTEHFPYKDVLPGIYQWLSGEDTHFYEAGGQADADMVFSARGVSFSTLICFEDTFGEIARRFANRGADLFINLTNDAWSKSVPAEEQHLAIAVFRAVENKRSMVRCTTSGITSIIDPDGVIIDRLPPFIDSYLVSDVPINRSGPTPARVLGDWCGLGTLIASLAGLGAGALVALFRRIRRKRIAS